MEFGRFIIRVEREGRIVMIFWFLFFSYDAAAPSYTKNSDFSHYRDKKKRTQVDELRSGAF